MSCVLCLMDRLTSLSKEGGGGKLRSWMRPLQHPSEAFFSLRKADSGAADVSFSPAVSENPQFTVWSGDLVKRGKVLFQISLHSGSPPFLPHRL